MNSTLTKSVLDHVTQYQSILGNRDYYLIVDRSGSQSAANDTRTGQTRWEYQKEDLLALVAGLDTLDPDGVTFILFNTAYEVHENAKAATIDTILGNTFPMGGTAITPPVAWALNDYLTTRKAGNAKPNGAMLVIVTDGEPSDNRDKVSLFQTIAQFTQSLPEGREEVGILFVQNGRDPDAAKFLHELDDDMVTTHGAKYDIVSVVTEDQIEGDLGITGALVSALSE